MAVELRVSIELADTDPNVEAGEPGIILRSTRSTSLVADNPDHGAQLAVARHRLKVITEEVAVDLDGQLEVAERNAAGRS